MKSHKADTKKWYVISLIFLLVPITSLLPLFGIIQQPDDPDALRVATPTPIPYIPSAQVWHELLRPTEGCPLPCWWGIIPGKTTLEEAKTMLRQRFEGVKFDSGEITRYGKSYFYLSTTFRISLDEIERQTLPKYDDRDIDRLKVVALHIESVDGSIIDSIKVSPRDGIFWLRDPAFIWEYFEITNMLMAYGVPTRIRALKRGKPESRIFKIFLYWEQSGIAAIYFDSRVGGKEEKEETSSLSPCFDFATLSERQGFFDPADFYFHAPNSPRTFEDLVKLTDSETSLITTITGLTNEEFVNILLENDGCLPADLPMNEGTGE